jgi:tRNA threonylcarbamoyladenosine biosynthesis protein TsaB
MSAVAHGPEAVGAAQAPNILAVETSTRACSVALQCGGEILHIHRDAPKQHNQLVLGYIDDLLRQAGLAPTDLDAVAFGRGPGSFTGVRIAAGIAQGISLGAAIPTIPVSTLQILAQTALDLDRGLATVGAVLRSRPGEIYLGGYAAERDGLCVELLADATWRVDELTPPRWLRGRCGIVGDGADCFAAALLPGGCVTDAALLPSACSLLRLAARVLSRDAGVAAELALPIYLEGTLPWRKATD